MISNNLKKSNSYNKIQKLIHLKSSVSLSYQSIPREINSTNENRENMKL